MLRHKVRGAGVNVAFQFGVCSRCWGALAVSGGAPGGMSGGWLGVADGWISWSCEVVQCEDDEGGNGEYVRGLGM